MNYAPIVVFAYSRPIHIIKTLTALSRADGAHQSNLYVFVDGPRNASAAPRVSAVSDVLSIRSWQRSFLALILSSPGATRGWPAQSLMACHRF